MIENPTGSFLFQHPPVVRALELCGARRITVHLLGFGGESMKPLWLAGTAPWLQKLSRESARRLQRSSRTGHQKNESLISFKKKCFFEGLQHPPWLKDAEIKSMGKHRR